jgi:ribulose-phosphate 3-epimerase
MREIIPAVMPDSYEDLREKVRAVKDFVDLVQVDIMDGKFVPSKSWPYNSGGPSEDEEFKLLMHQDEGLPYWDTTDYEFDLMIQEPEKHIDEWLPLGASRLIFHIESILDKDFFFRGELFNPQSRSIGEDKVIEIGLAINPDTSLDEIRPYIPLVDFVQVMGIAKIGYQGQAFDERVLTHINRLRVEYPNLIISVDGAVNNDTAKLLTDAGANRLVSGSAIFASDEPGEAIAHLQAEETD